MSVAIGIDLGTTNTVVAAVVDGVASTLEDEQGRRLLPSVVSFHPSSTVLVGEPARERRLIDPENTVFSVKPLLGRSFDSDEVVAARKRFPFQLTQGTKNSTTVLARDVAYALPEISAFVLRRAKSIAESALGQPVDRAVITVPANFNDLQRASTKIAGKLAGLDVLRILNEPTAAALAYGQSISKAERIGIYDLGGGTFDVTLLDLTGNVFEVLATAGDTALGGDDIDRLLADRIAVEVIKRFNVDPRANPASRTRLSFIAEELKKELSSAYRAQREITGVGYVEGGHPISMPFVMARDEIERIAKPLIERTIAVAKQSIEIIGLSPRDFDRVILVGGSTRMPLVARMVEQLFGQAPHLKVNPDEVVALGAAIQAHALNRSKGAHRRRSAHAQLAKAEPKPSGDRVPTRPPDADPNPSPMHVPRAPAIPTLGTPASPPAAAMPEFFTFRKAPAVISFPDVPPANPRARARAPMSSAPKHPAEVDAHRPPTPGAFPAVNVPIRPPPAARTPGAQRLPPPLSNEPPPAPTSRAKAPPRPESSAKLPLATASPATAPPPPSTTSEGDAPIGPKPARSASLPPPSLPAPEQPVGPSDIVAASPDLDLVVPDLDLELDPPGTHGATAMAALPQQTSHSVATDDFFHSLELEPSAPHPHPLRVPVVPEPALERFHQGSAITTSAVTPLLIDVTPLSLGVETAGGYADVLIPANSPVPCERTRTFLTASDHQTTVSIRVGQGESSRFAANTRLGDLELTGLRRASRGEVKIAVTFELDVDGILNVRARDQDTGHETVATMRLLGDSTDVDDVGAMQQRQARHVVA